MFKDIFKSANKEIKTPEKLKEITLQHIIENSHDHKKIYTRKPLIRFAIPLGVTATCLTCILAFILFFNGTAGSSSSDVYALGTPEYPSSIAFEDYESKNNSFEAMDESYLKGVQNFSFNSASSILGNEDKNKNSIYSPISLYMALGLLAETTQGSTREEILNLLSSDTIDLISTETPKLFRNLYTDNEIGKLNFANSLWLSNTSDFNQDTIDKITANYYAHSFSVDFSSPLTSKSISEWISKNTGGKLGNDPESFTPSPSQVMSIINTLYFYDQWQNKFDPNLTKSDNFYVTDDDPVMSDFMNTQGIQSFSKGDNYTSSSLNFKNQCSMVFVLPDEGVSPLDIINSPETLSKAINYIGTSHENYGHVTFEIPKFNFSNDLDLNDSIKALGVEEVFTSSADFSPLSKENNLFVSSVKQSATISIDENGCEAAAFTKIDIYGSGLPQDKAEMILNRPFIFVIKAENGIPLFIGIINNPSK